MDEPHRRSEDEQDRPVFMPPRRRRRGGGSSIVPKLIFGLFVLLAVGGAVLWLWPGDGGEVTAPVPRITGADPASPDTADTAAVRAEARTLDLPPLEASDSVVRREADDLSDRPLWASWLAAAYGLARTFVASVVSVAGGSSPAEHLEFMAPEGGFTVRESEGRTVIAQASYDRYDPLASTVASLDTEATARLYRQLHPLFVAAFRELGFEERSFDEALARAVRNVLPVEVPDRPPEVVADEGVYLFRDPELESLSPAAKHLLRMGPENARRVQAKLRELADAMEIDVERSTTP